MVIRLVTSRTSTRTVLLQPSPVCALAVNLMLTGLHAFLLSSSESGRLKEHPDGAMVWNEAGRITFAGNWKDRPTNQRIRWEDQSGKLVTPGFIDVHCHLPQYPVVACGGQELLPWLKKFIFPCERAFSPE